MIDEIDECCYSISVVPREESKFLQMLNDDPDDFSKHFEDAGWFLAIKWPSSLPKSTVHFIHAANDESPDKNSNGAEVIDPGMAAEGNERNASDSGQLALCVLIEKCEENLTDEYDLTDEDSPTGLWVPGEPATKSVRVPFLERVLRAVGF